MPLGKRRKVVELVERVREGRAYRMRLRLECGHVVVARGRVAADHVPGLAFCRDPECINPEAA